MLDASRAPTIRKYFEMLNAMAERIDQDWIPSRSSEILVLELRAIATGGLDMLEHCPAHLESSFTDPVGSPERIIRQVPDGTRP